jgi:soluble cytochrome b562
MKLISKRAWMTGGLTLALGVALVLPMGMMSSAPIAQAADDDEAPLEDLMGTISSRHKRLKRSIPNAAMNETSLKYVLDMQAAAVEAKKHNPAKTKSIPESSQKKFLISYRKEMNVMIGQLLDLENALLDGDQKAAQANYDKLLSQKKKSHDKFIEE